MRIALLFLAFITLCSAQPAGHDSVNAERWKRATIPKHRIHEVQTIVNRINKNKSRYETVSKETNVPWHVIASLHNMEAGGSFALHLHEGSSLKWRTKYIPKGRPLTGNPPFEWEYSAKDALLYDRMHLKDWNNIGKALSANEGYNGWGYANNHPNTPTPYNWAATSEERPGKYVADRKWSSTARSKQIGIAAIWKLMGK